MGADISKIYCTPEDACYTAANALLTKLGHEPITGRLAMSEFVNAIDANKLTGIDMQDLDYDFQNFLALKNILAVNDIGDFVLALNLRKFSESSTNTEIDKVNADTAALSEYLDQIPNDAGLYSDLFRNNLGLEYIYYINKPIKDPSGRKATIRIVYVDGSERQLVFKAQVSSGKSQIPNPDELNDQILKFYKQAAQFQPYEEPEMNAHYAAFQDKQFNNRAANAFLAITLGGMAAPVLSTYLYNKGIVGVSFFNASFYFGKFALVLGTCGFISYNGKNRNFYNEEFLQHYKNSETFVAELSEYPEEKDLMRTAYWLYLHQY